jgi:hypothetical protein
LKQKFIKQNIEQEFKDKIFEAKLMEKVWIKIF